ncbi:MAG: 4Fe-4S dicluster domain-containing protein [Rhodocyclaceae bacterium]|nr:MAG: 4Fe-4S dicluster domain-containing protein [Rhodocyclaceae bacterium]
MSRKNQPPWAPSPEHAALLPEISGCRFNGWGETISRRPRQIFWLRRPGDHPFARLLEAVKQRFSGVAAYREVYANADRGPSKLPEPATDRRVASADSWTRQVKAFVLNQTGGRSEGYPGPGSEAELVGIANIDPAWVYEGFESKLPHLVIIGNVMNHARLSKVPSSADDPEGQLEVCDQYNRGARVVSWLAHWIRSQGYRAQPHAGPWVGSINLLPAAIACGIGELGKHGSLINRQYGSSFRLAAVETDMPLVADTPDRFGADDFCLNCQVCTDACPPDAINRDKQLVRGTIRWAVDFDRCIPYFNETYGCGICIARCPWSTPGRAPKLAERWSRRAMNQEVCA